MSLRRAIVEADPGELNVTEFCRSHGVSTWFFWNLRRRYAADGEAALTPKSRAPHHPANRTRAEVEDAIVAKRKELDDAGLDCGSATIAFHLRDLPGLPSESTIWRILTARGQIVAQPAKAPKHTGRSFTAERANECWALDDTDWALADGTAVKILDVIDDHSRYCVAATAMLKSCTGAAALAVLAAAAAFLGWPTRFWSDNAKAFKATLAAALSPIGVAASHSRPYHPQGNGKIERFHQTLQKWLAKQPAPPPSTSSSTNSNASGSSTTPNAPTAPSGAASPPTSGPPPPRADPPPDPSAPRPPSTTRSSTTAAATPVPTPSASAPPTTVIERSP